MCWVNTETVPPRVITTKIKSNGEVNLQIEVTALRILRTM